MKKLLAIASLWLLAQIGFAQLPVSVRTTNGTALNFTGEDTAGNYSLNTQSRTTGDSSGSTDVDWGNRFLFDNNAGSHLALDWQNRLLIDLSGATSIDWQNRKLFGNWNLGTNGSVYNLTNYGTVTFPNLAASGVMEMGGAGNQVAVIPNAGNNLVLHGTTPPGYSGVNSNDMDTATAAQLALGGSIPAGVVRTANNGNDFASASATLANLGGVASNGLGLTNGTGPVASLVNIHAFGALGNGADDTVAFQAAAYSGVGVFIPPPTNPTNIFTIKSTVFLTNNTTFIGCGNSIISYSNGSSGFMFWGTNGITNVTLAGLFLTGNYWWPVAAGGSAYQFINSFTGISQNGNITTNRSGLFCSSGMSGSRVTGCTFSGFSDTGFRTYGNGGAVQPNTIQLKVDNCYADGCWIGFQFTNNAEYVTIDSLSTANCGRGLDSTSGNLNFTAGVHTKDGCAIHEGSGNNAGSDNFSGILLNHNVLLGVQAENWTGRSQFIGCMMVGDGGMALTNINGFIWKHGYIQANTTYGQHSGGYDIVMDGGVNTLNGPNFIYTSSIQNNQEAPLKIVATNSGVLYVNGYIRTNFIGGLTYSNSFGAGIEVGATPFTVGAAAAGVTTVALEVPANPTNTFMIPGSTNTFGGQTLVTSLVATNYGSSLVGVVPMNGTYQFTNRITTAGGGGGIIGGWIQVQNQ
jgi:hypothetical protein